MIWYPTALDNATATRSYAVNGYWDPASSRPNLQILTGHRVDEVLFDDDKRAESVVISERGAVASEDEEGEVKERIQVKAGREIVVAAGAIHSPQVLQRSGVGPQKLLQEAGVEVVVDLPGVGSNLQDHAVAGVAFRCKCPFPHNSPGYEKGEL